MTLHCAYHHVVSNGIVIYSVQCALLWLPVSVSTETVHGDDQLSHRCSNPHKLYIITFTIGPTVTYCFLVIATGSTSAASSVRLKYPIFYKTAHWPTTISYTTLPILTARSIYKYNMSALFGIATPSSHHKEISAKFIAVMKSVFLHLFTFSKAMNAG
mgnify:CR=1 FL=1